MKTIIVIGLLVGLGGCANLQQSLGAQSVADLCTAAYAKYASLKAPNSAERVAKKVLDVACRDPATTAEVILDSYKIIVAAVN